MVNTNLTERVYGGWSIPAERVDGTDALAVFDSVRAAVRRARSANGPQAVEALSLRMHGHAAHDDASYVSPALREEFAERFDPVARLGERLRLDGLGDLEQEVRENAAREIAEGLAAAEASPAPDPRDLEAGVWAAPPDR
jgi:pyruvate dehydrogenase E1 component alpha subunit